MCTNTPYIVDNDFFSSRKHIIIGNSITAHIYRGPYGTVIVKLAMWRRKFVKIACECMLP